MTNDTVMKKGTSALVAPFMKEQGGNVPRHSHALRRPCLQLGSHDPFP